MATLIEDLINKQTLLLNYLEQNYELKRCVDTGYVKVEDRWYKGDTPLSEIEEELKLFYPFGERVINMVVDVWLERVKIKRGTHEWSMLWLSRIDKLKTEGLRFNDEDLEPNNIDAGPLRLQTTYTDEMFWRIRGERDAELRLLRELANHFIIEIADERATRALHECTSIRRLEDTLQHLGFEKVLMADPMMGTRTIRWVEHHRAWDARRRDYYNRRRVQSQIELELERLQTQRGLIERQNYERLHRAQALQVEEQRRIDYEQEREQLRFEHGFGMHDNTRRHNLF